MYMILLFVLTFFSCFKSNLEQVLLHKEPYIYDVHTEGGLVVSPVFADSIAFK